MKRAAVVTSMLFAYLSSPVFAVTPAEDIAATIMLRGHPCGGKEVSDIQEKEDGSGNKTITTTCPNGMKYRIDVSADGQVKVTRL